MPKTRVRGLKFLKGNYTAGYVVLCQMNYKSNEFTITRRNQHTEVESITTLTQVGFCIDRYVIQGFF